MRRSSVLAILAAGSALAGPPALQRDVHYGPDQRQVLDFWAAPSDKPAPLVVYIHGGGLVSGSKDDLDSGFRDLLMQRGISVAAIDHRYYTTTPLPGPEMDCVRAVQFLRTKAREWNIDPKAIAVVGYSSGGTLALWIGYHDDFADPKSPDPVQRQSSRIAAIGAVAAATVLDPEVIATLISPAAARPSGPLPAGVSESELYGPRVRAMVHELSPATHLTRDDPPAFLFYGEPDVDVPANASPGTGIHHPRFGLYLRERCAAAGAQCIVRLAGDYNGRPMPASLAEEMLSFFEKHLRRSQ